MLYSSQGSPPYTWGITPIYMGSTLYGMQMIKNAGDHPHIHGEHTHTVSALVMIRGSPPYTWGARNDNLLTDPNDRITPIYMGSTIVAFSHIDPFVGSPPYTWGAPWLAVLARSCRRITPIYMGSTVDKGPEFMSGRDHPHIHGEHRLVLCIS